MRATIVDIVVSAPIPRSIKYLKSWKTTVLIAPLLLSGCAIDALRVETATEVSTKGRVALAVAHDELARIAAQREALNLDYVGLDSACAPAQANLRLAPQLDPRHPLAAQPRGWLCAATPIPQGTVRLSLKPASRELAPALLVLDGVGQYLSAITAIVAEEKPTTAADFTETIGALHSAEALIRAGARSEQATLLPPASNDTVKAIADLIGLVDQLNLEHRQVRSLRELVASNNAAGELIAAAQNVLGNWEVARSADASARSTIALFVMTNYLQAKQPPASEQRRQLVKDYYARADAEVDDAALGAAVSCAFAALAAADSELRSELQKNPNLSASKRAELARLTRRRVASAFDALTTVITAIAKV